MKTVSSHLVESIKGIIRIFFFDNYTTRSFLMCYGSASEESSVVID